MNLNEILREVYENEHNYERIHLSHESYSRAEEEIREMVERKIAIMR
jgi:hypothetical protein